jgi:hypothetical protein
MYQWKGLFAYWVVEPISPQTQTTFARLLWPDSPKLPSQSADSALAILQHLVYFLSNAGATSKFIIIHLYESDRVAPPFLELSKK